MNKNKFAVIGFGSMLILLIAACAPQQVDSPINAVQPAVEEPAATEVPAIAPTEIDMEAFIASKVDGHHDLDRIFNATKTRAEWETTLDRMIGRGAKVNEEEKQMIIDYLLSR